jgi:hypothetical protein
MSFSKNRSGVPYLKSEMPRVLLPREPDSTAFQEKQEALNAFRETIETVMGRHHTAFLNMFKQMMIGVFGPGMEKMLSGVRSHIFYRGWRNQFCSASRRSTATARSTNPATSTKHWESASPAAFAKQWRSTSSAAEPVSGDAQ